MIKFEILLPRKLPAIRYSATWDVDVVIRHLRTMGENESLSLKQLSQKLALLMALVDASRVSELQALDLRYRSYHPEGVIFQLPILGKKRVVGVPPKQVMFGAFPEDSHLCVVKCLRHYEAATSQFRNMELDRHQPLFLSYVWLHAPVTSQRIANWLKEILKNAGVDTTVFKTHSVRGASSTAAAEKGVLMEDILCAANWSTDSTFRRFYYCPNHNNSYATAVLQSRSSDGEQAWVPEAVATGAVDEVSEITVGFLHPNCNIYWWFSPSSDAGLCALDVFGGLYHLMMMVFCT